MVGDTEARDHILTEPERAMMDYAAAIATDASRITAGQVDALKQHGFTDAEIFDIAAIAAARAFLTKLMDALGAEPDSHWLETEEAFRNAMTRGRSIGFKPVERLPETPAANVVNLG